MSAERRRFGLDTDILIYATETGAGEKGRRAELIVRRAVATRRRVLATLGRAGCAVLLSEDMQDGAALAGVTVRDPLVGDCLPDAIEALLAA